MDNFKCVSCGESLELDETVLKQDQEQCQNQTTDDSSNSAAPNLHRYELPNYSLFVGPSCGTSLDLSQLPDVSSTADDPQGLGTFFAFTDKLHKLVYDDNSAIEHPMCQSCTDKLLDYFDQTLSEAEQECREYKKILDSLDTVNIDVEAREAEQHLAKLKKDEENIKETLKEVQRVDQNLDLEIEAEQSKLQLLTEQEAKLWRRYRDLRRKILDLEQESLSAMNQYHYANSCLKKLEESNALNMTFHIWHSGHFGTINGYRLGRLPDQPVSWTEINTAFGQAALLMHTLIKKAGLKLERYELVPFANYSYLVCLQSGKELRLYTDGGVKFNWHPRFDQAIVAFVDCLCQLEQRIRQLVGVDYNLPYKMRGDKIEDGGNQYSVRTHFNSEERWTKAMKCLLTNLKWALAAILPVEESCTSNTAASSV
ncbi:Beclin-1-like protein [Trichinella pseudospiralis]|uniref:Beclin-1-like protein n=2 Tax=Trichinella pseudospiralis TaxID=6337 RepID=A0A0V1EV52_TRIPS|nr:Beclin-1-like protein [Trichinella pseudospiralis]KRY92264.1 Beclin-1-like protein [Trichinella pseudospiralis]KRZ32760.1 Beclin-1-like protein [Trichinella pseudospiralis]KRZ43792.1 Beclin-1-like protein [Trichinella pseudospiralis]